MKLNLKIFLAVFSLVFLMPAVLASDYYMFEIIDLEDDGTAHIKGETNLDILTIIDLIDEEIEGSTQELTNKKGIYWYFLYKTDEVLSDYEITIRLPLGSVISGVDSSSNVQILTEDDRNVLIFRAENKSLDLEIEYFLKKGNENGASYVLYSFLKFFCIFLIAFLIFKSKNLILKNLTKKPKDDVRSIDLEKISAINLF